MDGHSLDSPLKNRRVLGFSPNIEKNPSYFAVKTILQTRQNNGKHAIVTGKYMVSFGGYKVGPQTIAKLVCKPPRY